MRLVIGHIKGCLPFLVTGKCILEGQKPTAPASQNGAKVAKKGAFSSVNGGTAEHYGCFEEWFGKLPMTLNSPQHLTVMFQREKEEMYS